MQSGLIRILEQLIGVIHLLLLQEYALLGARRLQNTSCPSAPLFNRLIDNTGYTVFTNITGQHANLGQQKALTPQTTCPGLARAVAGLSGPSR